MTTTPIDDANSLLVQHAVRRYLSDPRESVRTIEGACIVTRRIGNRYGVPADTLTYRYEITQPDLGFAISVRAAWRCGDLFRPLAVHTVIEDYEDLGSHGPDQDVRLAANDWLQSLVG